MSHPQESTSGKPPSGGRLPLIGAQISTAGGLAPVPERAALIGAEVVQIFASNPRTWQPRTYDCKEITAFVDDLQRRALPLFLHTIYLINLASPDEALRLRSAEALSSALVLGALTKAAGVVTHMGSHKGARPEVVRSRITATVAQAIAQASRVLAHAGQSGDPPALPPLLLENSAGSGTAVAGRLEELSAILPALPVGCGICLDTAHLFAAGYAVHTATGLARLLAQLEQTGLLAHLRLIHLNDSKTPFGSRRDQHENPGAGHIGEKGLARIVRHPALAFVPFVLEVPGQDGRGPDAPNLAAVKLMRRGAAPLRQTPAPPP